MYDMTFVYLIIIIYTHLFTRPMSREIRDLLTGVKIRREKSIKLVISHVTCWHLNCHIFGGAITYKYVHTYTYA